MITIRPGSQVHQLLRLLSAAGEIPSTTFQFIGNERSVAALVHKLESVQDFRLENNSWAFRTKLLQVSGKKEQRTIRLYKAALPVLDILHPAALDYYMYAFLGHKFPGNPQHIQRNHRVAEALALCMSAGVEICPYALPVLQKAGIQRTVPDLPCFYIARDIKKIAGDASNKTAFTRITGALFCRRKVYAVYNSRGAVMKWSGLGEVKALGNLMEITRMNAGLETVDAALLFGADADTALKTVLESDRSRRPELRFDRIYRGIHFVPLNHKGARLLKLLILPDWNEKLLSALFEPGQRSYNRGAMEYDAVIGGRKTLSYLDGDIARLIRFREALNYRAEPADVLCYPWQTDFLKSYLRGIAGLRELDMDTVEDALRE